MSDSKQFKQGNIVNTILDEHAVFLFLLALSLSFSIVLAFLLLLVQTLQLLRDTLLLQLEIVLVVLGADRTTKTQFELLTTTLAIVLLVLPPPLLLLGESLLLFATAPFVLLAKTFLFVPSSLLKLFQSLVLGFTSSYFFIVGFHGSTTGKSIEFDVLRIPAYFETLREPTATANVTRAERFQSRKKNHWKRKASTCSCSSTVDHMILEHGGKVIVGAGVGGGNRRSSGLDALCSRRIYREATHVTAAFGSHSLSRGFVGESQRAERGRRALHSVLGILATVGLLFLLALGLLRIQLVCWIRALFTRAFGITAMQENSFGGNAPQIKVGASPIFQLLLLGFDQRLPVLLLLAKTVTSVLLLLAEHFQFKDLRSSLSFRFALFLGQGLVVGEQELRLNSVTSQTAVQLFVEQEKVTHQLGGVANGCLLCFTQYMTIGEDHLESARNTVLRIPALLKEGGTAQTQLLVALQKRENYQWPSGGEAARIRSWFCDSAAGGAKQKRALEGLSNRIWQTVCSLLRRHGCLFGLPVAGAGTSPMSTAAARGRARRQHNRTAAALAGRAGRAPFR
mmetsp:Transcript_33248/g.83562  ORF Transcript_33248/g.83562 Transcript_33248/m.83562 type:complete len:567 (+) Transcript_33248:1127-2827(+)